METWESISSLTEFNGYTVTKGPVPEYDRAQFEKGLSMCRENKCGCYGTSWGCPPGGTRDVEAFYEGCDHVLVFSRKFDVDPKDRVSLERIGQEMEHIFRIFLGDLRKNGIVATGFLEGPCKYCGKCTYPEPCRYPEMTIASLSTLGIDLGGYLGSIDIPFEFRDDSVTLYGFAFVKKGTA